MIKIHFDTSKYWWYTVHARNGKTLVVSEMFKSKQGCRKGIDALIGIIQNNDYKIIEEKK